MRNTTPHFKSILHRTTINTKKQTGKNQHSILRPALIIVSTKSNIQSSSCIFGEDNPAQRKSEDSRHIEKLKFKTRLHLRISNNTLKRAALFMLLATTVCGDPCIENVVRSSTRP